jgi:hypothetical protein
MNRMPNKTIQQTVMSHALWFSLDHLPGSCLLLSLPLRQSGKKFFS